mmetsp:Transcript_10898/g.24610  ORF Transcript_10898/g.24610 Transcript_10898/m.24610 type:complete len:210 (-) Transcript_10898:54-683(-)
MRQHLAIALPWANEIVMRTIHLDSKRLKVPRLAQKPRRGGVVILRRRVAFLLRAASSLALAPTQVRQPCSVGRGQQRNVDGESRADLEARIAHRKALLANERTSTNATAIHRGAAGCCKLVHDARARQLAFGGRADAAQRVNHIRMQARKVQVPRPVCPVAVAVAVATADPRPRTVGGITRPAIVPQALERASRRRERRRRRHAGCHSC